MLETVFLAGRLFLAASLALGVAYLVGASNPYWAAMPVWVVHQTYREDLLSRAAMRIAGTLFGSLLSLSVVWMDLPVDVEIAVLALGVGLSATAAYSFNSALSYGAFMTGVTLFVVLLPGLAEGTNAPSVALDRILCTFIGVVCITAVSYAFTPQRPTHERRGDPANRLAGSLKRFALCAGLTFAAALTAVHYHGFEILSAAMTLIVYPLILSSAPDPKPIMAALVPGVAGGVGLAFLYLSSLSALNDHGSWVVVAVTGGFVAAGAFLRAWPQTSPFGLDANMSFLILSEIGVWRHGIVDTGLAGLAVIAAAVLARISAGLVLSGGQQVRG